MTVSSQHEPHQYPDTEAGKLIHPSLISSFFFLHLCFTVTWQNVLSWKGESLQTKQYSKKQYNTASRSFTDWKGVGWIYSSLRLPFFFTTHNLWPFDIRQHFTVTLLCRWRNHTCSCLISCLTQIWEIFFFFLDLTCCVRTLVMCVSLAKNTTCLSHGEHCSYSYLSLRHPPVNVRYTLTSRWQKSPWVDK